MDINYQKLGWRIKKSRENMGLSQESFAEKVDLSVTHVSNIENGNSKVSLNSIMAIANTLNVTVDYLLRDSIINQANAVQIDLSHIFDDCSGSETEFLLSLLLEAKEMLRKFVNEDIRNTGQ